MQLDTYKYMVGVRCMTYNHSRFIEETLNGFVKQETSFPVVFIIVDDASTDGEDNLLRIWAQSNLMIEEDNVAYKKQLSNREVIFARHKEKRDFYFALLLLKENLYSQGKNSLKKEYIKEWMAQGKYCATCEGDDYWLVPDKLQKQVEFMESHPEFSACATNSTVIDSEGHEKRLFSSKPSRYIQNMDEIVIKRQFHTASALWREDEDFYNRTLKHSWDTYKWSLLLMKGKIWYDDRVTCVYRKAGQGITNTMPKLKWIETNENWSNILYEHFGQEGLSYTGAYISLTRDILALLVQNRTLTYEDRAVLKRKYKKYATWRINMYNIPYLLSLYRNQTISYIRRILK